MSAIAKPSAVTPEAATPTHTGHAHLPIARLDLLRIAGAALAVLFCWLRLWEPLPRLDVIGLASVLAAGYPIYREAFADLLSRRMTMELSMTIALAAALLIGEVFTALVIVLFVLIAEVLEELTVGQGRRAIRDLLDFLPATALRRTASGTETIPAASLAPGDIVPAAASLSTAK